MKKHEVKKISLAEKLVAGLNEFAEALESGEEITERFDCHKVVLDLEPTAYDPELVKKTRGTLQASQAIFAQFIGVSVQTVRSWEQGDKEPSDMACRFMDEIRIEPLFWQQRLRTLVKSKRRKLEA